MEILGLLVVRKLEVGVLCDQGHEEEEKEEESVPQQEEVEEESVPQKEEVIVVEKH